MLVDNLEYNTEREHLIIPEYGRHIQKMVNQAIAMGYVAPAYAHVGDTVIAIVRGRAVPMTVTAMPFTPARYVR